MPVVRAGQELVDSRVLIYYYGRKAVLLLRTMAVGDPRLLPSGRCALIAIVGMMAEGEGAMAVAVGKGDLFAVVLETTTVAVRRDGQLAMNRGG
jgi:hypothetical protein